MENTQHLKFIFAEYFYLPPCVLFFYWGGLWELSEILSLYLTHSVSSVELPDKRGAEKHQHQKTLKYQLMALNFL